MTYVTVKIQTQYTEDELRELVRDTDLRDSGADPIDLDKVSAVDIMSLFTRGEFDGEVVTEEITERNNIAD